MPVSVVMGGQFGSEGKGKVSSHLARTRGATAVIRVGGPNSGHTAVDEMGTIWTLRQLPAGLIGNGATAILPAGSLIDVDILLSEMEQLQLPKERLWIDPRASIVTAEHRRAEQKLVEAIGSTASGTGAALLERVARRPDHIRAASVPELHPFLREGLDMELRTALNGLERIIVEGTQGFGLSIWRSDHFPFATSRDTGAATFVGEAGLAPQDVDEVVMVLRAFPIRVGGNSGPLENEIDWPTLAAEAQLPADYRELTSATRRVRRIGRFDPEPVRRALTVNAPNIVVMNHMDYVDPMWRSAGPTALSREFIACVEQSIGHEINLLGYGAAVLMPRSAVMLGKAA